MILWTSMSFLTILLFVIQSAVPAEAQYQSDTYFTANIIDSETKKPITEPVVLHVEEIHSGTVLRSFGLEVRSSPAQFHLPWYYPNYNQNTEIKLTAAAQGIKSDPFVYIIPKDRPADDLLFDHTFELTLPTKEQLPIVSSLLHLEFNGTTYQIGTVGTASADLVVFDQGAKKINLTFPSAAPSSYSNVTVPRKLLDGPYWVHIDNVYIHELAISSNSTHTVLGLDLEGGRHVVDIYGTRVVPEIPASLLGITAAVFVSVIVGIFAVKNRGYFNLKQSNKI